MSLAAPASPPPFGRQLARAGWDVHAVTVFLEKAAGLLRQLVCLAVWLVLLSATVPLLFQPHLAAGQLIAPVAGILAVLQGITPTRTAFRRCASADPPRRDPQPAESRATPDS